jgi:hypothetical protein
MTEDKATWAKEQMERASVPDEFQEMITRLLKMYWFFEQNDGLDDATMYKIRHTFNELSQGHALVDDDPDSVWVQAKPGNLVIRDRVRVRVDAYTAATGQVHNGREGDVVAIRHGDIHVRYDNGDIARHSPHSLDKRLR